jgi:hypothetical protein
MPLTAAQQVMLERLGRSESADLRELGAHGATANALLRRSFITVYLRIADGELSERFRIARRGLAYLQRTRGS